MNSNVKRKITFSDTHLEQYSGLYTSYVYNGNPPANTSFVDVRKIIQRKENEWLGQLDTWHISLCKSAAERTWLWWLMPGSRITTLGYPFDLKPLFFALGVIEFLNSRCGEELLIIGVPNETFNYINEWNASLKENKSLIIVGRSTNVSAGPETFYQLKPLLRAVKYFGLLAKKALLTSYDKHTSGKIDLLVFSVLLDPRILKQQGDHYFGFFLGDEAFSKNMRTEWFYLIPDYRHTAEAISKCTEIGRELSFHFSWVRKADFFRIIRTVITAKRKLRGLRTQVPDLFIGPLHSKKFPGLFIGQTCDNYFPVKEVALYFSMKNCLSNKQPTAILYPFEQMPIEMSILQACMESGTPVKTIAFAHANYNIGHRYMFNLNDYDRPLPTKIATTGPGAACWLVDVAGWNPEKIVILGSPRHPTDADKTMIVTENNKPLRVILLVGLGHELGNLATWCEEHPQLLDNTEFMVRRYPYAWHEAQDLAIEKLDIQGVNLKAPIGNLKAELDWADVCLFCSTSAGIEAMLRGKLAIRISVDDVFDTNPLIGKKGGDHIMECKNPEELKHLLNMITKQTIEEKSLILKMQYDFAIGVYAPLNNDNTMNILS
jgi:hypothetical protein